MKQEIRLLLFLFIGLIWFLGYDFIANLPYGIGLSNIIILMVVFNGFMILLTIWNMIKLLGGEE